MVDTLTLNLNIMKALPADVPETFQGVSGYLDSLSEPMHMDEFKEDVIDFLFGFSPWTNWNVLEARRMRATLTERFFNSDGTPSGENSRRNILKVRNTLRDQFLENYA